MNTLIAMTKRFLEGFTAAAPFLPLWAEGHREVAPSGLPVLRWLPETPRHTTPSTADLVTTLCATPGLSWRQTYAVNDLGADFLAGYGWTELIGLRGPLPSTKLAAGFLLLAPHIHYPRHHHAAEELYIPLSGTALWSRGETPFTPQPPGTPIHHPSRMPHAMRTAETPLLALYLWRDGDLAEKSTLA